MPAIRRQGRRLPWSLCLGIVASAWVFLRRIDVRTDFVFSPLGRPPLANDPKEAKVLPRTSGFSLGAKNTLVEPQFQGHALTGHPWPDNALATSMSLNP
ncbi:hypothetical protein FEA48_11650 [Pseudomonas nitroreducens]|uniref:Uncharacterized protein n=1 Tax=Pseudomonas nitroreducens TaxID=46680 RepID=A0A5R9A8A0_PSENT|nr:hypothetical protein [Pseudomonas nitroreducens]TLP74858.1 hypothetical protein FEA48_11650 [Pseudomonas nitroreducens]